MNIFGNPKYLYMGTKAVLAHEMTQNEFNKYMGQEQTENCDYAGYLTEHMDQTRGPNHKDHKGFITWTPRYAFDVLYSKNGKLSFGDAVELLKSEKRVTRSGWNGKGMWLELQIPDAHSKMNLPYIYMKTADGGLVPWLASQTDILAEDWQLIGNADVENTNLFVDERMARQNAEKHAENKLWELEGYQLYTSTL